MKQNTKSLNLFDNEILLELENAKFTSTRPDGFGITLKEYVTEKGIPESTARRHFQFMVKKHGYRIDKYLINGKWTNVLHK